MGFDFGLEQADACLKRKFRWLFKIPEISASDAVNSLPPLKSARPKLTFKEMEVQHVSETIYYPTKPEWQPLSLVLFDLKKNINPIFDWLQKIYNPCRDSGKMWRNSGSVGFKKQGVLELYDGCGGILESWKYENIWPQSVDFGDLDMGNSDYVTAEITLRYDRAFVDSNC